MEIQGGKFRYIYVSCNTFMRAPSQNLWSLCINMCKNVKTFWGIKRPVSHWPIYSYLWGMYKVKMSTYHFLGDLDFFGGLLVTLSWVESWVGLNWMEGLECVELSWWFELCCVDLRWLELVSCVESETKKVGHMKAFASSKWAFRGPLILEKAKAFSKWILGVHNSLER